MASRLDSFFTSFLAYSVPDCPGDGFEPFLWDRLPTVDAEPIRPIAQTVESLFDSSEQMTLVLEN
jgi:hypothetical protein